MKLYAQHGSKTGDKLLYGLDKNLIDGIIYSPKDISLDNLKANIHSIASEHRDKDLFVDPQYYAVFAASSPSSKMGYLIDPDTYAKEYFMIKRRGQLEKIANIREVIQKSLSFQCSMDVTGIISPNILISRSFDSIEASISKNFIMESMEQYQQLKDERPLYVTLAISREALTDKTELSDFLNDITLIDNPPDGFYLLISAGSPSARMEIYNDDIIAGWMLINHSLKLNGYKIINGYSDIITPFLGAAGGDAGASGWWSNLRIFSLERFLPQGDGGRLPLQRYLSCALLNRITFYELDQLRTLIPEVLNNLPLDSLYNADNGSEPERSNEVYQSWEAIKCLNSKIIQTNISDSLIKCQETLVRASNLYDRIRIGLDSKSNRDHLEPLTYGVKLFTTLAEIDFTFNKI